MAPTDQPQPDFNNLANSFRSLGVHERDMAALHDNVAEQLALLPNIDNGGQILRELREFREELRTELRALREETQAATARIAARITEMELNMVAVLNNSVLAGDGTDRTATTHSATTYSAK
ncbi:hypothetical protein K440DRAFT_632991 [Wilcoxina mikolae CBS 423.85]|nr:hypothetical protein K440DRAFT_632991 [Wilcoxina mikolae CBS 423.85]